MGGRKNGMLDLGGTLRDRTPEETLALIQPLVKKASITRLADITYLDCLNIPVYTCIRPYSTHLTTSQGKGLTPNLAICSATMEAIEHYFAQTQHPSLYKASYDSLDSTRHLDPNQLPQGLYQHKSIHSFPLHWINTNNLLDQTQTAIPEEIISFDFTNPTAAFGFFNVSTTGLASGNSFYEAQCHALLEIIERNCLTQLKTLSAFDFVQKSLNLTTITSPLVNELLEKIYLHDIGVTLVDLTNDLDIPTFYCNLTDPNPLRSLPDFSGSGAHLNPDIALTRAITEAAQARLTYITGTRDDIFPSTYRTSKSVPQQKGEKNYQHLARPDQFKTSTSMYHWLINHLHAQGISKILSISHTNNTHPISVVHTLIPGLAI
jgi:YcaO-like protein with predicted kinase domain